MTTSATTVSVSTSIKPATPWMRAAILNQAISQGFTHLQVSSNVDRYTKGAKVIEVSWSNVVTGATITLAAGKSPKTLAAGHQGKLQALTTALGHKVMSVTQKWSAGDLFILDKDGNKVKASASDLKVQAEQAFQAMAK
jgi:hypothetical protein